MNRKSENSDFLIPNNSVQCGHLVFVSEVAWVGILTDPWMSELACGSFEHILPRVRIDADTITIQYRDFSSLNVRDHLQKQVGAITLNPLTPWEIEFREHISNLHADLRGLVLRSLDLLGGARQIELLLSNPIKTSFIYIPGGIENSVIHVPTGVGIRVQLNGSIGHLFFDARHFDAPGGNTSLENALFQSADNRYDICITGAVSNLTIEEQSELLQR